MTNKNLGRGLSAFLSVNDVADISDMDKNNKQDNITNLSDNVIHELHVNDICANPNQPRKVFDDDSLLNLSNSIKRNGVLQPVIVVRNGDKYQLIAGERRLRASILAGKNVIPAIIKQCSIKEQLEIAILENIQREDLNPIDEAESYKQLINDFHYTQEELSTTLGKSRSHVANILRLLQLTDYVKELVREKKISFGLARSLIGHENANELADSAIAQSLSVRQVEDIVKSQKSINNIAKRMSMPIKSEKYVDPEMLNISQQLSTLLGLDVSISMKNLGGVISINFQKIKDLDLLMQKLQKIG